MRFWCQHGSILAPKNPLKSRLGGLLERLESVLETSWAILGTSWSVLSRLGASWRRPGASWARLGRLGASWSVLDVFRNTKGVSAVQGPSRGGAPLGRWEPAKSNEEETYRGLYGVLQTYTKRPRHAAGRLRARCGSKAPQSGESATALDS